MSFVTHDELIYFITSEYPALTHGKDFWVGQPMGDDGAAQSADAFIAQWNGNDPAKPTDDDLKALETKYLPMPAEVPDSVTSRQFMIQLVNVGKKADVDAWVSQQDEKTQMAYQYSAMFVRSDPMMQSGFTAMGFTADQIDQFFTDAAKL